MDYQSQAGIALGARKTLLGHPQHWATRNGENGSIDVNRGLPDRALIALMCYAFCPHPVRPESLRNSPATIFSRLVKCRVCSNLRARCRVSSAEVSMETLRTSCCVVGGGPAGVMLGYLLGRAGIKVTVLEKHADFFRDFRGDTVHPSTLDIMHQLGLLDGLLQLPHQRVTSVSAHIGDFNFDAADFRLVPTHCKFVALMPQWDFLNFLSERAKRFDSFGLRMGTRALD